VGFTFIIGLFFYDKDTYIKDRTTILLVLSFGKRDTRSYVEADMHIENYKKLESTIEKHAFYTCVSYK
jgi:hypothetical protein